MVLVGPPGLVGHIYFCDFRRVNDATRLARAKKTIPP